MESGLEVTITVTDEFGIILPKRSLCKNDPVWHCDSSSSSQPSAMMRTLLALFFSWLITLEQEFPLKLYSALNSSGRELAEATFLKWSGSRSTMTNS